MKLEMMKLVPAGLLLGTMMACSSAPGDEASAIASESDELVSCPTRSAQDDQMRAAATLAMNLMKDAAVQAAGTTYPTQAYTILATQRYRIQSSGTGIEFDPADPYYAKVTNAMKAHLAFAQQDASVAKFLSDGIRYAMANTDGQTYPQILGIPALLNYKYPGPVSIHIPDQTSSNDSHNATVTGQAWCGTSVVTIAETVSNSWQFSPMKAGNTSQWRNVPAGYVGTKHTPWTAFNGASSSGNPYLIVSVNGAATNWATYNFAAVSCNNMTCNGQIQVDPVPYAEPGEYYVTTGLVGTQANPFSLSSTVLYAVPEHASQWATRTVNGVQEWGTFSTPVTLFGMTQYKYSKKM